MPINERSNEVARPEPVPNFHSIGITLEHIRVNFIENSDLVGKFSRCRTSGGNMRILLKSENQAAWKPAISELSNATGDLVTSLKEFFQAMDCKTTDFLSRRITMKLRGDVEGLPDAENLAFGDLVDPLDWLKEAAFSLDQKAQKWRSRMGKPENGEVFPNAKQVQGLKKECESFDGHVETNLKALRSFFQKIGTKSAYADRQSSFQDTEKVRGQKSRVDVTDRVQAPALSRPKRTLAAISNLDEADKKRRKNGTK